ncbi:MAG TPA: DUF1684 domain-containing protein [Gemmatimonadales bacterium]|jgi:hypothetical protein|nr:DUF1684 domain-containing protein [Gemmatimonadales bacterium]
MAVAPPSTADGQNRAAVLAERVELASWLRTAPLSPLRAVTVRPVGPGLSLGPPSADVPLEGVSPARLSERGGRATLRIGDDNVPVARGRPVPLGAWRLVVSGPAGRGTLTVFGAALRSQLAPFWYEYDRKLAFTVALVPDPAPSSQRILAPDGVEVDATPAGSVELQLGGVARTLRVMRLPGATEDESELEIYFRDATADHGTYPAGRFVPLSPLSGGRYLLDFNRARNPFCAYNTVYPCPAPWKGNTLAEPIIAGERYQGSTLRPPAGARPRP